MIKIYCNEVHQKHLDDCDECNKLFEYAVLKINNCPQKIKPKCVNCKIHCYHKKNQEKIKIIMRYSGPKMIWKHPILTLKHFIK